MLKLIFFSLLPSAAQTEEFIFQNLAYGPTVYQTGVNAHQWFAFIWYHWRAIERLKFPSWRPKLCDQKWPLKLKIFTQVLRSKWQHVIYKTKCTWEKHPFFDVITFYGLVHHISRKTNSELSRFFKVLSPIRIFFFVIHWIGEIFNTYN